MLLYVLYVVLLLSVFLLQYISFSKRFVPEAINFLDGVLVLATKKKKNATTHRKHSWHPVLVHARETIFVFVLQRVWGRSASALATATCCR